MKMVPMQRVDIPAYTAEANSGSAPRSFINTQENQTFLSAYQSADFALACQKESAQPMSMEAYKLSIYEKISRMPFNPCRNRGDIFMDISEEAFAAMKNDPSYEKWVLDTIQKEFSAAVPFGSNTVTVLSFGAKKEDFKGESWSMPSKRELERMRKERWERKEAIKKKRKKLLEKQRLEEKWKKEAALAAFYQLKRLDHIQQTQEENKALRLHQDYTRQNRDASLLAAARRKAGNYEASFLYTGIGMIH